jgi:hypothetical protein
MHEGPCRTAEISPGDSFRLRSYGSSHIENGSAQLSADELREKPPMSVRCFRSSRPDPWTLPRPACDPSARLRAYGPVQPMVEEQGLLGRLFWR